MTWTSLERETSGRLCLVLIHVKCDFTSSRCIGESDEDVSVQDLIKSTFEAEKLERKCLHCSSSYAWVKTDITQLPRVFVIYLKRHKYSAADKGILYLWFYNPISAKLVICLPDWIAPNLITTIGFVHTVIPLCVLFAVDDFTLLGPVPRWFCFLQAYCYFAYRMLDEMDGK